MAPAAEWGLKGYVFDANPSRVIRPLSRSASIKSDIPEDLASDGDASGRRPPESVSVMAQLPADGARE
jgi:hypothetical protein